MLDSLKFLVVYVLMVGAILMIGWDQPLRYRFMSREEIAAINAPPAPTPKPGTWMWDSTKRGNQLERRPYAKHSTGLTR